MRAFIGLIVLVALVVVGIPAFGQVPAADGGKDVTAEVVDSANARADAAEDAKAQAEAELAKTKAEAAQLEQRLQQERSARSDATRRGDKTDAERHRQVAVATSAQIAQVVARISSIETSMESLRADHHELRAQFENFCDQPLGGYENQLKFEGWFGQTYRIWPVPPGSSQSQPPASAGGTQPPSGASDAAPKEGKRNMLPLYIILGAGLGIGIAAFVIYCTRGNGGADRGAAGPIGSERTAVGVEDWPWQKDTKGTLTYCRFGPNYYVKETRRRRYRTP